MRSAKSNFQEVQNDIIFCESEERADVKRTLSHKMLEMFMECFFETENYLLAAALVLIPVAAVELTYNFMVGHHKTDLTSTVPLEMDENVFTALDRRYGVYVHASFSPTHD